MVLLRQACDQDKIPHHWPREGHRPTDTISVPHLEAWFRGTFGHALPQTGQRSRGGAPAKADWFEYYRAEILPRYRELGPPDEQNEKGWRTAADLEDLRAGGRRSTPEGLTEVMREGCHGEYEFAPGQALKAGLRIGQGS
jgi:hypothetical protein